MISVIIPVYNVRDYLDRCIESVVNQTYSNIEILLVEGQSTDGSDIKCQEWQNRDKRIRVMKQLDRGLGSARNLGIKEANYDIIAFLDADDWWDATMLEKLYNEMVKSDADMVMCDRYNVYYNEDGSYKEMQYLKEQSMYDAANSVEENPNLIRTIEVSVNGKLYKKSLFTEYNIWQPNIFGEDRAIMYYLISKCKRIGKVQEALYYYHCARQGNSVGSAKTYATTVECMEYVRNLFVEDHSEEKYEYQLAWIEKEIAAIGLEGLHYPCADRSFDCQLSEKKITDFLELYYPDLVDNRIIWGSYNLRRMSWLAFPQLIENRKHFCYSSIVSLMSEKISLPEGLHDTNHQRNEWLFQDWDKTFTREFHPKREDILLIDFLEERFDLIEKDNSYVTDSPMIQNGGMENISPYHLLRIDMDEVKQLWYSKCLEFIKLLKQRIQPERIILVRMKLTEKFGTMSQHSYFTDIFQIRRINQRLEAYYNFFEKNFDGINVVDCCNGDYFYTDENFWYGCYPWHVNDNFYIKQAEMIRKIIKKGE